MGGLDDEIRLARAQLDAYLGEHGLALRDGYRIEWRDDVRVTSQTITPHFEVVLRHLDGIRKLELAREQLRAAGGGAGVGALREFMDHLRARQGQERR